MSPLSKRRVILVASWTLLIGFFSISVFSFGYQIGRSIPETITVKGVANIEEGKPSNTSDFSLFWEVWNLVDDKYLKNKEVTAEQKTRGAIQGLISSLQDPYSQFFSPDNAKKFQEDIRGNFGGIGAEIGIRNEILTVVSPLKNTPAIRAGLMAGDLILKIDGDITDGLGVEEAVNLIRGPEGSTITLLVLRKEWKEPKEFKIVRSRIIVPTLDFEMKDSFAYIQLHSFNAVALPQFAQAVSNARAAKAKGIILDLRNNPGGFLSVAVDLAGWFLEPGTLVVSEEGPRGPTDVFKADGNGTLVKMPTVILINEGSASASEILAGALHDNRKIKLIGEKTFGKGVVQEIEELRDGSSVKITVAHWVLPSGKILEEEGIAPDVPVKLSEEDIKNKRDPQLEKAIELLRKEISVLGL
ncbi:MAG: S41 family peptidase [Patescibacteria group bacterium]